MLPQADDPAIQPIKGSRIEATGARRSSRVPIPLPKLQLHETIVDEYYTVTSIDKGGRLADRSPLQALRWRAADPVRITAYPGKGIIAVMPGGPNRLTGSGFLCLPAGVRHACHLHSGDRLLTISYARQNLLIAVTAHSIMSMIKLWLRPPNETSQP